MTGMAIADVGIQQMTKDDDDDDDDDDGGSTDDYDDYDDEAAVVVYCFWRWYQLNTPGFHDAQLRHWVRFEHDSAHPQIVLTCQRRRIFPCHPWLPMASGRHGSSTPQDSAH